MSHTVANHSESPPALPTIPDPEVAVKPKRRQFTAEYKRRIVQEAEACTPPGEMGALLRREGLYSSHLTTWRQQRQRGELHGLAPAKRGRQSDPHAAELARSQRENAELQAQVERAALIIDVQKKRSQLLGLPAMPSDDNT